MSDIPKTQEPLPHWTTQSRWWGPGEKRLHHILGDLIKMQTLHPTPVLLPGKSHGQRSLVGCSPWGCEESDTTEQLHFHFSLSCTGEGNGNPLQCSCLENPRDGRAWWAAIYGVTQSRTQLMWLSSRQASLSFHVLCLLVFFSKEGAIIPFISWSSSWFFFLIVKSNFWWMSVINDDLTHLFLL